MCQTIVSRHAGNRGSRGGAKNGRCSGDRSGNRKPNGAPVGTGETRYRGRARHANGPRGHEACRRNVSAGLCFFERWIRSRNGSSGDLSLLPLNYSAVTVADWFRPLET